MQIQRKNISINDSKNEKVKFSYISKNYNLETVDGYKTLV